VIRGTVTVTGTGIESNRDVPGSHTFFDFTGVGDITNWNWILGYGPSQIEYISGIGFSNGIYFME